jgi:hypothetical protein
LLLFSIFVAHDARLQLYELVLTSPKVDMANFLSFDVYILIFRKLWMILIWILFCYKWRASLSSLWNTSIGFLQRNQRTWACSSMFIFIFLYVVFWHSKRWPIATRVQGSQVFLPGRGYFSELGELKPGQD